jgi:tetratricopeptide (TPR) repeat protein
MLHIKIKFEKQNNYKRIIEFPDGSKSMESGIILPQKWTSPETWSWVKPFHEYSLDELKKEGRDIALSMLGIDGIDYIRQINEPYRILIIETLDIPEISKVPWELACIEDNFITIDSYTPIVRKPDFVRFVKNININKPIRIAMISASPDDQNKLMVEQELMSAALSLSEHMTDAKIIMDEIFNCTKYKLKQIVRTNKYDMLYFTGHGAFSAGNGYLVLESDDKKTDLISANDFASLLRTQRDLSLVFLNCCNSGAVKTGKREGFLGFNDVARKVLKNGIPEVIATQASVFDITGRKLMKTFFEELFRDDDFDVAKALSIARSDVETDDSQFHDFYHFIHFSALDVSPKINIKESEKDFDDKINWREKVVFRTPNYMELGHNFIGRFSYISKIEEFWRHDDIKCIGIYGFGGIGKTYLCNRMEQRTLSDQKFDKSIWLDFREGSGDTEALFITQLANIAHDLGFSKYRDILDDYENFPTPLEKLRPFVEHLKSMDCKKVLLILDNLETIVNEHADFNDENIKNWFQEFIAHTPHSWKILITCRFRFEFFPHGRQLAKADWIQLSELGFTERLCFINSISSLRNFDDEKKTELIKTAGGHPYLLNLVVKYVSRHFELPQALIEASKKAAIYARLDFFLSLLTEEELDWLVILALFPKPIMTNGVLYTKGIRDSVNDVDFLAKGFDSAMHKLTDLSLVDAFDNKPLYIKPIIAYQLFKNKESSFCQSEQKINDTNRAIGVFFLSVAEKTEKRPDKAACLFHGIEPVLAQNDMKLINDYLQACAGIFLGFIPASAFVDIVKRAEGILLKKPDKDSFHTLGFCAQTLREMRHFKTALSIFEKMFSSKYLPDSEKGRIFGEIGTIYFIQRDWENSLKNYEEAIKWKEKTSNYIELGSTFHQIGMVYEKQQDWKNALKNYNEAIKWKEKTGNYIELGSTFRNIGNVYLIQKDWENALKNYEKSIEWDEKTDNYFKIGMTFANIGSVYLDKQDWKNALKNYEQAIKWFEKTGNYFELGLAFHQIARVYEEQKNISQALEFFVKGLQIAVNVENHEHIGACLNSIKRVLPYAEDEEKEKYEEILGNLLSEPQIDAD